MNAIDRDGEAPMVDRSPSEEIERLRHQLQEARARSELRRVLLREARAFILENDAERRRVHVRRSLKIEEALERFKRRKSAASSRIYAEPTSWSRNSILPVIRSILRRCVSQNRETLLRSTQMDEKGSFQRADLEREILQKAKHRAQGIEAIILEAAKPNPKPGEANWRLAGIICGGSDRDDAVAAAEWAARLFADCLIIEGDL